MRGAEETRADLRTRLLDWFDEVRRPMPWRDEPSPYRIWISEIMLQQTQVTTVMPYFERFVARFPDVASLAAAEEEEVLALWSGLGYYRRARSLHQAARQLVAEWGGRLPENREELALLPGLGPYSAGAIASIAFGKREAALDGNGIRVLTRLHALSGDPARQPLKGELWRRLAALVQSRRPGDLNQAVMELGGRVCKPRRPLCDACPLFASCVAGSEGRAREFPQKTPGPVSLDLQVEVGLFRRRDAILFCRGARPFLTGLWNLPWRILAGHERLGAEAWEDLGLRVRRSRSLGDGEHRITRYRIQQRIIGGDAELRLGESETEYCWVPAGQRASLGLPAFSTKVLRDHAEGDSK